MLINNADDILSSEEIQRRRTMQANTWFITGISSGFGYEMTKLLLAAGKTVIGTVRRTDSVKELIKAYPQTLDCQILDVTDVPAIKRVVSHSFEHHGTIDVIVSNAGYGLFGAVEELSDEEINEIIATNLLGSIQVIKTALPYLRKQGHGRIIQMSTYGAQVAFAANSMYHATKFGIEGFCEALAQEVLPFGIGVTMVEPGGARTQFRYGSAKVAKLMPEYAHCHQFLNMLDPAKGLAPGDPVKMAERIIESVAVEPAPLCMMLGSQALRATIERLQKRLADYENQAELAASTDYPAGQ